MKHHRFQRLSKVVKRKCFCLSRSGVSPPLTFKIDGMRGSMGGGGSGGSGQNSNLFKFSGSAHGCYVPVNLIEGMLHTAELFDRYSSLNSAASNCNKKFIIIIKHTLPEKKEMTKRSSIERISYISALLILYISSPYIYKRFRLTRTKRKEKRHVRNSYVSARP